jgi:hypothetical protein
VDLMFAIVLPDIAGTERKACLKEAGQIFGDPAFQRMLRSAKSSRTLYDMIIGHSAPQSASA